MIEFFKGDGETISPFVALLYVLVIILFSPVILLFVLVYFIARAIWLTVKGVVYFATFFLGAIFFR